jgi:UDP-N-acetylmuramate dehydrogenase
MEIIENHPLHTHNTFGIVAFARYFIRVIDSSTIAEAVQFANEKNIPFYVLGGGSNVLFTNDYNGVIMHLNTKGRTIVSTEANQVIVKIEAGENWHETVLWTLQNHWGGIENLSLIPGNTGAAPIQNIGAYGVELSDVLMQVNYFDTQTLTYQSLSAADCQLGYRTSIFKTTLKKRVIITSVELKLTPTKHHSLKINYGDVKATLAETHCYNPTISDVSKAIIAIRMSKLPDPAVLGNAGSYFKNVIMPANEFEKIKAAHPLIAHYPDKNNKIKVPTAWLIANCGLQGYTLGKAGIHLNHALVLVNHGGASGADLMRLAAYVQEQVYSKFNIRIEPEVNYV